MKNIIITIYSLYLSLIWSSYAFGDNYQWLRDSVNQQESAMIDSFKQLHQNPELAFQENETAAIVAKSLGDSGYQVYTGIGGTGVVGILKNGPGPVVLFRGDMDALPVKEAVEIDYQSHKNMLNREGEKVPVMHACGHDAHTAWLMAVAKTMAESQSKWSGTLLIVAQPAEEIIEGATAMVNDGLYNIIPQADFIVSGHVMPFIPVGSVSIGEGPQMAGTDQIDVLIYGVGGHGSMPHMTKDPVVMAAQAVLDYQVIISRLTDQSRPAVLTVGALQAGETNNVIPDSALLKINLRWFDESIRQQMINGIKTATDNIAKLHGVNKNSLPQYTMKGYSRPVINDVDSAKRARTAMINILGEDKVLDGGAPLMGSEDFHMLAGSNTTAKVLWVKVGSGPADVISKMQQGIMPVFNHNPSFYVEPKAVPTGALALSAALVELLKIKSL